MYVKDLKSVVATSSADLMKILDECTRNKRVYETMMSCVSSRSHTIFTITVEGSFVDGSGESHVKVGKLNLVDLAGSERQCKTGATG